VAARSPEPLGVGLLVRREGLLMESDTKLLEHLYEGFNARDMEAVLGATSKSGRTMARTGLRMMPTAE